MCIMTVMNTKKANRDVMPSQEDRSNDHWKNLTRPSRRRQDQVITTY